MCTVWVQIPSRIIEGDLIPKSLQEDLSYLGDSGVIIKWAEASKANAAALFAAICMAFANFVLLHFHHREPRWSSPESKSPRKGRTSLPTLRPRVVQAKCRETVCSFM